MVYRFHDYTLDPAGRELWHGPQRLTLEPKVLQVLLYLLEHRDRLVTKAELLEQCWPETLANRSTTSHDSRRPTTSVGLSSGIVSPPPRGTNSPYITLSLVRAAGTAYSDRSLV